MKIQYLKILLIISLLLNGLLLYHIKNEYKINSEKNRVSLVEANRKISNAVKIGREIKEGWNDLSDMELIIKFDEVEKELEVAMRLMDSADSYFAPVRHASLNMGYFSNIISAERTVSIYEDYCEEYEKLVILSDYLYNVNIKEQDSYERHEKWENYKKNN